MYDCISVDILVMFGIFSVELLSLITACCRGHFDILKVLIDKGANINDKDNVRSAMFRDYLVWVIGK